MKSVRARDFVASGTIMWELVAALVTLAGAIAAIVVSWGVVIVFFGLKMYLEERKLRTRLLGSAVRVGPYQFQEVHRAVIGVAQALGVRELPDVFILESNEQNAFAVKHGKRHAIVLVDDIVFGAMATNNRNTLVWIIAHEIAHHVLGHSSLLRSTMRGVCPPLARLDEMSCDAIASAVVDDAEAVRSALGLLLVGPQLFPQLDHRALEAQVRQLLSEKRTLKRAESMLSHPLLVHRYAKATAGLRPAPAFQRTAPAPAAVAASSPAFEPARPAVATERSAGQEMSRRVADAGKAEGGHAVVRPKVKALSPEELAARSDRQWTIAELTLVSVLINSLPLLTSAVALLRGTFNRYDVLLLGFGVALAFFLSLGHHWARIAAIVSSVAATCLSLLLAVLAGAAGARQGVPGVAVLLVIALSYSGSAIVLAFSPRMQRHFSKEARSGGRRTAGVTDGGRMMQVETSSAAGTGE